MLFWVVTPCRRIRRYQRCGETYCLHGVTTQNIVILTAVRTTISQGPDDGGSKHLWNVSQFLPDYTVQHPRRSHLHIRRRENLKSHECNVVRMNDPIWTRCESSWACSTHRGKQDMAGCRSWVVSIRKVSSSIFGRTSAVLTKFFIVF
jgi:hypothetical protein